MTFEVTWYDGGVKSAGRPDPNHPDGKSLDYSGNVGKKCIVDLPYPNENCGVYEGVCTTCGAMFCVAVQGRPDDIRQITIACDG